jgi:hypothetical protein
MNSFQILDKWYPLFGTSPAAYTFYKKTKEDWLEMRKKDEEAKREAAIKQAIEYVALNCYWHTNHKHFRTEKENNN